MKIRVINEPPKERIIADMEAGETGYTVPWALTDGVLDTEFSVREKGGTASLWIECIIPGEEYAVDYEQPIFRNRLSN